MAFAENNDWTVKTDAFVTRPPDLDLLGWHTRLRTRSKLGFPCLICGATEEVEMHHVRHIRKMGERKPTGFHAVMRALNRKQIPVCKGCHEKTHRGEYDGILEGVQAVSKVSAMQRFAAHPHEAVKLGLT